MEKEKLVTFLSAYTQSERRHLSESSPLTSRYERINKKVVKNNDVYLFNYHSLLDKKNIAIMKNSRFMSIPLHIHGVIEMNYVFSGSCAQTINGKKIYMKSGDVCILDMNVPHSIEKLEENDIVLNIIMKKEYFNTSFLNRWSQNNALTSFLMRALDQEQSKSSYLFFDSSRDYLLQEYMIKLCCEYFDPKLCSNEVIDSLMTLIFSQLVRLYSEQKSNSYTEENNIIRIIQYLESNYKTCTLKTISQEFSFHPNYMSQYIKKHTGSTFKDLVIQQRIIEAKLLLQYSTKSISEISRTVGYENTGFFYKKFNSIVGVSPSEFRNKHLTTYT